MRYSPRSADGSSRAPNGGQSGSRGRPSLSPAIVTMVRHRIAIGFYDTREVRRAICEGVLDESSRERGLRLD